MAASGKRNKRTNWKPLAVNELLESIPARKPVGNLNWADEVEEEDAHHEIKPYVLPTAPKASRGNNIDESKIPSTAPFQAYLSNIPYDLTENELINFFQNLKVKSVRIPRDEKGGNRAKGFGYIEFEDRASLVSALGLSENPLKGRLIRIEITTNAENSNRGGRGGRGNRDGGRMEMGSGGSDRTVGNWRTGPRADDFDDRGGGGGSSSGGYDRGGYSSRRDFGGGSGGGGFSRGFEERGFFRDDRGGDRFGRDDQVRLRDDHRGGGGFNQGGFDRSSGRERDDRVYSSFSDRDRDRGYNRRGDDDKYSREDRGRDSGGHWRDESNYNRNDERRGDRDRDRGGDRSERGERYGGGGRRGPPDDLPPADRGGNEGRRKLNLLPKSKFSPAETEEVLASNSSIFGGAKPVDTAAREREIEERLRRGDEPPDLKSKSAAGSSTGSQKDVPVEKRTEPAPPPKENPWSRNPTSTSVVNNGRSSPEEVRQSGGSAGSGGGNISDEERNEPKSWGRGGDTKRHQQEPKRIEETKNRGPQLKGVVGGNISSEKSRGKEEKQTSKPREGRKEIDDISRMPKIQESKVPNFADCNKFSTLGSDETPLE